MIDPEIDYPHFGNILFIQLRVRLGCKHVAVGVVVGQCQIHVALSHTPRIWLRAESEASDVAVPVYTANYYRGNN